jgi:hypothetical protein
MQTIYNDALKAHLSLDDQKKVRYIHHSQEYWQSESNNPRTTAEDYLQEVAGVMQIPSAQLHHLKQWVSYLEPREDGLDYRLSDERNFFDATTYGFYQTYLNVPVWGAGLSVTVKHNPGRVIQAVNTSQEGINAKLPDAAVIERFKSVFKQGASQRGAVTHATGGNGNGEGTTADPTAGFIRNILRTGGGDEQFNDQAGLIRGRFFVYKYDASKRQSKQQEPIPATTHVPSVKAGVRADEHTEPSLPLPPVAESIKDGNYYLVAEITFSLNTPAYGDINWLALVELETSSILYIEPLASGVNGLVYTADPITSTGVLTNTANLSNAALNTFRDDVALGNLDAPMAGTQFLRGSYANVINQEDPNISAPTRPSGSDFDYDSRTNEFAAVNAYYHVDRFFEMIEDLGFSIPTYFSGTTFPIPVDHRDMGNEINAHCVGNGSGGIGHVGYGLNDTTDIGNPLGRAVDKWVHWHELGGHGILYGFVNSANFGFAHSAGDGLAAIQNDPESMLRALPERFRYAPFRAGLDRWFNRDVAAGWAWGGTQDLGGYNSEQILATTHFRLYRSLGGDAADLGKRLHAARVATYLILRAVSTLTPATNPGNPLGLCNALMTVDLLNWTSEGLFGGAYNKVIRWAYEKQGLFQPVGAPTPVSTAGAAPAVDVYIDDGRGGEYQYQHVHWNNTSVWNRNSADGGAAHQPAILGATNYAYVKVKNRGTSTATNVVIKGYHCLPGAGLTWPNDFAQMGPIAGIAVGNISPNNTEEVIAGPFEWTPNENIYGHDCMLMIASATGDASNVDNFTGGESIQEWRLVPHDNNVGQRNVDLVPGGGGGEGLISGLQGAIFYAGNTLRKRANMELKVQMPNMLRENGWQIKFKGMKDNRFVLKAGEKRMITIDVIAGKDFSKEQALAMSDRDITVSLMSNDMLVGGMTYRLDPEMKQLPTRPDQHTDHCADKAAELLKCLHISDSDVKKVCVKKISLDIEMKNECKCD